MAQESINDWVVELGIDTTQLEKGIKRAERMLGKLAAKRAKTITTTETRGGRSSVSRKSVIKEQDELKTTNSLEAKRLALLKSIQRAKRVGVGTGDFTGGLQNTNIREVERKRLQLEKLTTLEKEEQRKIAVKSKEEAAKLRAEESIARSKAREEAAKVQAAEKAINGAIKKGNVLEAKRLTLLKAIERAKGLGIPTSSFTEALQGVNSDQVTKRKLELERLITLEKAKQRDAPVNTPQFSLASERQLKLANTIDSVVRRANRQLGESSEEFKKLNAEAQKLKTQITGIRSPIGLEQFNNKIRLMRDNITASSAALRKQAKEMENAGFAASKFGASINNLAAGYASIFAIIEGGRAFLNVGRTFDSLNASLLAAAGTTEAAAEDFMFIKDTSLRLGIGLKEVAEGYKQIGTAGRFSNLTTEQTRDIFLGATEASRAFGLSADRSALVFRAFSQILSKGKVTQEELRQQLGEQIPAAMALAAKAMNVTTEELNKMITAGIPATEFLPKFAAELRNSVKESGALAASLKTITAAEQRLSSALQLVTLESFQAGAKEGIVFFFEQLTAAVRTLRPAFRVLGKIINVVGTGLGILIEGFTLLLTPLTTFIDLMTDLPSSINDTQRATEGFSGALEDSNKKASKLTEILAGLKRLFNSIVGVLMLPFAILDDLNKEIKNFNERGILGFGRSSSVPSSADDDSFFDKLTNLPLVLQKSARNVAEAFGKEFEKPFRSPVAAPAAATPTAVEININGATEPTVIADEVNLRLQDMFKAALPTR